ncbi:MAG: hypothetical protein AOA65_1160 [Candidatus Bathyarchaeota archaeon BA1]|nr:MAG: hypothetical protein AOA65_1160 [Candidatus Bathyarchaeota archaeon BA1]
MAECADPHLWLENLHDSKVVRWFSERDKAARKRLRGFP